MKKISLLLFPLIGISACNGGGGSSSSSSNGNTYPANPTNVVGPNNSYQSCQLNYQHLTQRIIVQKLPMVSTAKFLM